MENQKEIWKDIPNYEGLYQASNLGRIKSLKRVVCKSDGTIQTFKERILKYGIDKYYQVALSKNGIQRTIRVHKLVAICFLNHKPDGLKEVVDHIDNNPLNNCVSNLQLTTNRHNSSKDKSGGTSKYIGVSWHKSSKKWRASLSHKSIKYDLGYFKNEIEAHKAYQAKLKEINDTN